MLINEFPPNLQRVITRHEMAKDQILFQQGELTQAIYWVEFGRLKLVSFTEQQVVTYYSVETGESFAETALYFETYGYTAIAEQPSRVIAIPKQIFLETLRQSLELSEQYRSHLTHRFFTVTQFLELRSIRSARNRLLRYLTQRRPQGQATVTLDKPLNAIADELALLPESLSRLLAQLQADGVITRKKRSITFSQEWLENVTE
ncbi:MAG: Crp/Fnr family transcriptional regulator [Cyanobacteria bacterium P01_A01_bin.17]